MGNLTVSSLPEKKMVGNEDMILITDLSDGSSMSKRVTFDAFVQSLWKKIYEQPVLVRCGHCDSINVVTNSNCVQCGAPGGGFLKLK